RRQDGTRHAGVAHADREPPVVRARAGAVRAAAGARRPAGVAPSGRTRGGGVLLRRRRHGHRAGVAQGAGPARATPARSDPAAVLTVLNVPNFLTLLRLLAIPLFLILLEDFRYPEALAVFIGAGVTDALDGAIARLTHTKTTLGSYLDPAADKLLLLSAF